MNLEELNSKKYTGIKLATGELIYAELQKFNEEDSIVVVKDPVNVEYYYDYSENISKFRVSRWPSVGHNIFNTTLNISTLHIVAMTLLDEEHTKIYHNMIHTLSEIKDEKDEDLSKYKFNGKVN